MRPNRRGWTWLALGLGGLLSACAPMYPSPQLVDARLAYANASTGNAATYAPESLADARRSLDVAEMAFINAPGTAWELQSAYNATQRAHLAQARGDAAAANAALDQARATDAAAARQRAQQAQAEVERQQRELQQREAELQAERDARAQVEAERATSEQALQAERDANAKLQAERNQAIQTLRELAMIRETERGLVITLAGSLLFRTDEAVLLPIAQQRLDQVAVALRALAGGQPVVIEGHTDSIGSTDFNRRLSAARAEAVRGYLVSRGVPPEQIVAVAKGEDEPVASNASPEGRANNRRVEIVISRAPVQVPAQPPAG